MFKVLLHYACMYVYIYACMHVCLSFLRLSGGFTPCRVYVCVYMYVCMYVCIMYVHRKPSLVKQLSPKTSFASSLLTVLRARTFALSRKRADDPIVRYLSVGTSI